MTPEGQRSDEQTLKRVVEVTLADGQKIHAQLDEDMARAELGDLHDRLQSERFLRIGQDTVVRSEDVRWVQVRPEDNGSGLIDSLVTKVRGGNEMSAYEGNRGQQGGPFQSPWLGYGRRPYSETKPFFLTSEFLAFVGMLVALLVTIGVSDSLNEFRGWLLPTILTSAYIVSRGIAKAGEKDPNPNRSHANGAYSGRLDADQPLGRERQTQDYGTAR